MSTTQNSSGGIGFTGALVIVFIVLKLTGNVDWSWFWVLSPIIFVLILFSFLMVVWLIIHWLEVRHSRRPTWKDIDQPEAIPRRNAWKDMCKEEEE